MLHNCLLRLLLKHRDFLNIDISQGSIATRLECDGVFKYDFVTNFLLSLTVKEFWKSVNIWQSYGQEYSVFFDSQCSKVGFSNEMLTFHQNVSYIVVAKFGLLIHLIIIKEMSFKMTVLDFRNIPVLLTWTVNAFYLFTTVKYCHDWTKICFIQNISTCSCDNSAPSVLWVCGLTKLFAIFRYKFVSQTISLIIKHLTLICQFPGN